MVDVEDGYVLVEFKRDFGSIRAEVAKYPDLQGLKNVEASTEFSSLVDDARAAAGIAKNDHDVPVPHYIVYGDLPRDVGGRCPPSRATGRFKNLSLWMTNYWEWKRDLPVSVASMSGFPDEGRLKEYLEFLAEKRTAENGTVGVSGGLVSVQIQGKQSWIPLSDILRGWGFEPRPTSVNAHGMK